MSTSKVSSRTRATLTRPRVADRPGGTAAGWSIRRHRRRLVNQAAPGAGTSPSVPLPHSTTAIFSSSRNAKPRSTTAARAVAAPSSMASPACAHATALAEDYFTRILASLSVYG